MKLILIIISLLSFNISMAEVQGQMVKLDKGAKAPYDGILSDAQQMKFFRYQNEKLLKMTDLIEDQNELNRLQKNQSEEYKNLYQNTAKELRRTKTQSTLQKVVYFGLGVLFTGAAVRFSGRK